MIIFCAFGSGMARKLIHDGLTWVTGLLPVRCCRLWWARPSQYIVNAVNLRLSLMSRHPVSLFGPSSPFRKTVPQSRLCYRESLRSSARDSVTLLIDADRQLLLTSRRRLFDLYPISTAINYQWIESWCNLSTLSGYTRRTAPLANQRCDFIRSDQWRCSAHIGGRSQKPLAHNLSDPSRSPRGALWALTAEGNAATTPDSPEICCKLANNAGACNVCSRMLGVN